MPRKLFDRFRISIAGVAIPYSPLLMIFSIFYRPNNSELLQFCLNIINRGGIWNASYFYISGGKGPVPELIILKQNSINSQTQFEYNAYR